MRLHQAVGHAVWNLLLTATIASSAALGDIQVPARVVYVEATAKNQVNDFYNRLATVDRQVVVTAEPHTAAAQKLIIPAGHDLYVVETQLAGSPPLPNEIARIDALAFVTAVRGANIHLELKRHDLYAERVVEVLSHRQPENNASAGSSYLRSRRILLLDRVNGLHDSQSEATNMATSTLVDIDQAYLEQKLKEFSGMIPTQIGGEVVTITERGSVAGRNLARAWLKEQYEALGFTVSMHNYGGSMSSFVGGTNFIAERTGTDPTRYLIVSAHLDSVSNAGADDDGAGTISALATAQALQNIDLAINLRIVGFDEEERGLVGSSAYARYLSTTGDIDGLVGVMNLEMTAYDADDDGAFHVIDCNENTSADLSALVRNVVARDPLRLSVTPACTSRSDHAAFWRYNKPAVVVSQNFFGGDSNPCYHRGCDKTDRLNFSFMQRLTTAVARAVAGLVVMPE
jgi:hypothetical protein